MQVSTKIFSAVTQTTQCLVVACFEDRLLSNTARTINHADAGQLEQILKREKFTGKAGQSLLLLSPQAIAADRLLVIGFGALDKQGCVTPENARKALQKIPDTLKNVHCSELSIAIGDVDVQNKSIDWLSRQVTEILIASQHRSDGLKSKPSEPSFVPTKINLGVAKAQQSLANRGVLLGQSIALGVNFARYLGDLPANVCTPSYLADQAKKLTADAKKNLKEGKALSCKILEEKAMNELGMGSLLSVSAGSEEPAKLIVLEYTGTAKKTAPIALVGKGITFDTGGISLKPGPGMDEMKFDMCGAASVLGTFKTLIELQPAINVVGIIAASENMPSGKATKPGDIVTSMSGQTIEILNTEGRLVLCDALTYTERFKPKAVIDIATLTGACVIALGAHASGLFSNNQSLAQALLQAGEEANDRAWQMPLWDDYQKQLDSNFADIANIGGREAGSITAACFLARFTKKFAWAHLDIAGTAWNSGGAKGATGRPVSLLVQYLLNQK
jgi:leucyl aminopeptidase